MLNFEQANLLGAQIRRDDPRAQIQLRPVGNVRAAFAHTSVPHVVPGDPAMYTLIYTINVTTGNGTRLLIRSHLDWQSYLNWTRPAQ